MRGDEFYRDVARRPPFSKLHPDVAAFLKEYLAAEKVVPFAGRQVINTHFPPYPGAAFDRFVERFSATGSAGEPGRLFSVTWAVTNRCRYRCWHCYNAGRRSRDLPLATMKDVATQLQELGATVITLTGGEPLLRDDLEEIAAAFDERTSLVVGTTGDGLTVGRARRLHEAGVFAMGVSLDSTDEAEHDRLRGVTGAFQTALAALRAAEDGGLYPYVVSVATREFLEADRFMAFVEFAGGIGAREVHLLEPSATGRLAGRQDVLLTDAERKTIADYQQMVNARDDLPTLSCFAYLESDRAFGCGAGRTHLYIDGSGEVSPCNLVPLSFGNVAREPLEAILDRMGEHFREPRCGCVGRLVAPHVPDGPLPLEPEASAELCARCLPREHELPRFFRIRKAAMAEVGAAELRDAYDRVHGDYDEFWLAEAAAPIDDLLTRLGDLSGKRVLEAGCGTGYATAMLAARVGPSGRVIAADLSAGMLAEAKRRVGDAGDVEWICGDALEALGRAGPVDLVFTSWVLGYIALAPFLRAAASALAPGGRLAFVVHRENSPREPSEIFAELVAEDPSVLTRRVAFDFPRDADHVRAEIEAAGLAVTELWEGAITFRYRTAEQVLEHLLKSGAGTAFHDAIDPARRAALEEEFLRRLAVLHETEPDCPVTHDYLACVAAKP